MINPFHILRSAVIALALALSTGAGGAATHDVTTGETFAEAFRAAAPGDRIVLAPGDYGAVRLKGGGGAPDRPVTILSQDATDPARFSALKLNNVSHVVLDGLFLDYTFVPGDELRAKPFVVESSRDVTLRNLVIDGDEAHDLDATSDGLPAGFGLIVARSESVTLENNEIRRFMRGQSVRESSDLRIIGNDLHGLRMDGMTFAQVEDVMIQGNRIHDFNRSSDKRDHADMIQFWTAYTTSPSRNITIRDNLLHSGTGHHTQSIFMGNELVQRGKAGEEMYYRDVTIENNLIINAHKHGIALGASIGVRIANNTLVHNPASDGSRDILALYRPQLGVLDLSRDVTVENNIASKYNFDPDRPDWTISGNIVAQDTALMKPNHYTRLFLGKDAMDPASFLPKPGGPLDGTGIGVDVGQW